MQNSSTNSQSHSPVDLTRNIETNDTICIIPVTQPDETKSTIVVFHYGQAETIFFNESGELNNAGWLPFINKIGHTLIQAFPYRKLEVSVNNQIITVSLIDEDQTTKQNIDCFYIEFICDEFKKDGLKVRDVKTGKQVRVSRDADIRWFFKQMTYENYLSKSKSKMTFANLSACDKAKLVGAITCTFSDFYPSRKTVIQVDYFSDTVKFYHEFGQNGVDGDCFFLKFDTSKKDLRVMFDGRVLEIPMNAPVTSLFHFFSYCNSKIHG